MCAAALECCYRMIIYRLISKIVLIQLFEIEYMNFMNILNKFLLIGLKYFDLFSFCKTSGFHFAKWDFHFLFPFPSRFITFIDRSLYCIVRDFAAHEWFHSQTRTSLLAPTSTCRQLVPATHAVLTCVTCVPQCRQGASVSSRCLYCGSC